MITITFVVEYTSRYTCMAKQLIKKVKYTEKIYEWVNGCSTEIIMIYNHHYCYVVRTI